MNIRDERYSVSCDIRGYTKGMASLVKFDSEIPIRTLAPFISDIDNAIFELKNGNFVKARAHLRWLSLTVAMGNAKRRNQQARVE